jgi:hypothetical protein
MNNSPETNPMRKADPSSISTSATASRPFTHLWQWWSTTLTGPRTETFGTDVPAQERQRRSRLISALLTLNLLAMLLFIPSALSSPSSSLIWISIALLGIGGLLIALLNRAGLINLSAVLYLVAIDGAITSFLVLKPALNCGNLSDFDLYILAVLVGGMILPRFLIPFTGLANIALIVGIYTWRPHDTLLVQLVQIEGGQTYTALASLIVLQLTGTGIAWLHAWSVRRSLMRASRAEELAEARAALNKQAMLISEQNRRLEEGIAQILETHQQIAAGNLAVRAPAQKDQTLWQVGQSLNMLLRRFQQQAQEDRYLRETQQEIEQVIDALFSSRSGNPASLPPLRTPLASRLYMLLTR